MTSLSKTLAIALEAVGCVVVLTGISIEVMYGAHIGFVLITGGSVIVA